MKKFLAKVVEFFLKEHPAKYAVITAIFVAVFTLLLHLAIADVVSNVFGTVVGFLISTMLLFMGKIFVGRIEDVLKISYDTEKLLDIYSGDPEYKKTVVAGDGSTATFAYADVMVNTAGLTVQDFHVQDDPEKVLELDDFIVENYATIFSAHSNSAKKNFDTIRLDHYDDASHTFYLSRSTYFNHLVTNRAVDFLIFDNVSLRTIYEYGPLLNSLEESKMSNHVGINALVFLSDGRLLIPRRKNNSTISKNQVTSSIAVMLNFPNTGKTNPKKEHISVEYLLRDNIFKNLSSRVKLPANAIAKEEVQINFLGFGQNIYEGGKPQLYYSVKLNNIDTKTYFAKRAEYIAEQKRLHKKEILDVDKCMYVADFNSFHYKKSWLKFDAYDTNDRRRKVKVGYEMSYLCNIWHHQKCQEEVANKNCV